MRTALAKWCAGPSRLPILLGRGYLRYDQQPSVRALLKELIRRYLAPADYADSRRFAWWMLIQIGKGSTSNKA